MSVSGTVGDGRLFLLPNMPDPAIVKVSLEKFDPSLLDRPAAWLAEGKLVAIPTDTVYALAANADNPAAMSRLCALCGRSVEEPLTLLVADSADVHRFAQVVPPVAHRLMGRFWPGPLTLILPRKGGGSVSLRHPANKATLELIQRSGVPVAAPSAALPKGTPAGSAEEVARLFGSGLDAIVDAGLTQGGKPSTVVRCSKSGFSVVRLGALGAEALAEGTARLILFVCLGNTCRSPMAASLMKKALAEHLGVPVAMLVKNGYDVKSAGTSAVVGDPMSDHAKAVLRELGCEPIQHVSQPTTARLMRAADHVFVMNESQRNSTIALCPDAANRVELLDREGKAVEDPFGGSLDAYRRTAGILSKNVNQLLKKVMP
ncbi:MAG: L-threonylcarbamoyladenylate synthase [Planctomycetota bacterium]|nr:L-threonylcarbamoyladenylate synthase [Planctomycetota bacterium]